MSSETIEVRALLTVLIPKVTESQDIFHSQVGQWNQHNFGSVSEIMYFEVLNLSYTS